MIRVLLILFLISLSTHYAKANELNVSINSYSDAAAYIQAAALFPKSVELKP